MSETLANYTALIDLIMSGKLQPEEAREKSCKDLEELICTEYKDSKIHKNKRAFFLI
ncbi:MULTISPECIES: hypothetical protein [unclassified Wolbachia]|uniref:hypothetical protein n=1 Tax=unclassified Wolbachia TaxID=2640676 RepID=UPI0030CA3D2E